MTVRTAAAGNIVMLAARVRAEAEEFDSIGERGIGDRMKRTATEIELAARLLREHGKGAQEADTKVEEQEEALASWEKALLGINDEPEDREIRAGDRVRITNKGNVPSRHATGTEFVVKQVGTNYVARYAMDDDIFSGGVYLDNLELVASIEAAPGARIKLNEKGQRVSPSLDDDVLPVLDYNDGFWVTKPVDTFGTVLYLRADEFIVVEAA